MSEQFWGYLTQPEVRFLDAAVSRLIPADDLGPGAREAGVTVFIDRQMCTPYGLFARGVPLVGAPTAVSLTLMEPVAATVLAAVPKDASEMSVLRATMGCQPRRVRKSQSQPPVIAPMQPKRNGMEPSLPTASTLM